MNLNSFGTTLAAFPTPPSRAPSLPPSDDYYTSRSISPGFESASRSGLRSRAGSSPLALSFEQYGLKGNREEEKEDESEEMVVDDPDDDSDRRTVTGIPATPSTASSGWSTFWSEVSPVPIHLPTRFDI